MELGTALMLGMLGSLHCAGMCGPLALALPISGKTRISYATGRIAYNCGRIVTYCVFGVIFGLVGRTLVLAGIQRWASIALGALVIAGLLGSRQFLSWNPAGRLVNRLKAGMAVLLRERSIISLGSLGMLNGLLPCGLVYIACAGAIATGGVMSGVVYMAVFGVGTVPMMLGISMSGRLIPAPVKSQLRRVVPVSVFLVATLLILRGMSLGIPYVSPDLSNAVAPCCH
jgi:sulfite exporter TauE/SafE